MICLYFMSLEFGWGICHCDLEKFCQFHDIIVLTPKYALENFLIAETKII